jgi:5-formyltetrahydrofolate cyclo-ligase
MDWTEIKEWRRAQRAALLEGRVGTPREKRQAWSAVVENHLRRLFSEMPPQTIGIYMPFKGEFDPRPLVRALLGSGWKAALPVVVEKKGPLEFRAWRPGDALTPGVYDIPIPVVRDVVAPAVLLVPVVGFDRANYRLGYGGGYYDRTLAAADPRPMAIGVGFELSRLDTIHPQPHDIPLNAVVTEEGAQR